MELSSVTGLASLEKDRSTELVRRVRFAGVLFLGASAMSFPAGFLVDPVTPLSAHLLGVTGVAFGLLLLRVPERALTQAWVHAALLLGIVEVALSIAIFSDDFAFNYVLTGIFAAYAIDSRKHLAAYMGLMVAALALPLAYSGDAVRDQAHHILVTLPVLLIGTLAVRYLRETLEARESEYRGFAEEAIQLAGRIRRGEAEARVDVGAELDELAAGRHRDVTASVASR